MLRGLSPDLPTPLGIMILLVGEKEKVPFFRLKLRLLKYSSLIPSRVSGVVPLLMFPGLPFMR